MPPRPHRPADLDPGPEARGDRAARGREPQGRAAAARRWGWRRRAEGQPARVAVVGAGPAGVSCAHDLALLGYGVTLFDAAPVVGGMLYQGVPEYRLPRDLIRAEIDQVLSLGVELQPNWRLGRDFTVGDLLRNGYAAVFLALGASRGRELNIPGRDLDGVINGVDFLLNANLGYRVALGERVIVVGGGNVAIDVARTVLRYASPETREAIPEGAQQLLQTWGYDNAFLDAARTALRLGARHVQLVSLESRSEMPAHPDEVREAEEEGITLVPRRGPKAILGERGHVVGARDARRGVRLRRDRPFQPHVRHRQREADGGRHDHPGRRPAARYRLPGRRPRDHDHASRPGRRRPADAGHHDARRLLWRGSGLRSAHRHRGGRRRQAGGAGHPRAPGWRSGPPRPRALPRHRSRPRRRPIRPHRPAARARAFPSRAAPGFARSRKATARPRRAPRARVACGATWRRSSTRSAASSAAPASRSARRPASPWCPRRACAERPSSTRCARRWAPDGSAGAIVKDEERCIRCGLCAQRCPTGAITMEALELDESPQTALGLFHEAMAGGRS